jgi:hypothetical protein
VRNVAEVCFSNAESLDAQTPCGTVAYAMAMADIGDGAYVILELRG